MAPSTALCFALSGLALLVKRKHLDEPVRFRHTIFIWILLIIAGAKGLELIFGHVSGLERFAPIELFQFKNIDVHMAPLTAAGFLIFGIGLLVSSHAHTPIARVLVRGLASTLLIIGLSAALGYELKLQYIFEDFYLTSGLNLMAFHTTVGMILLGIGLWSLTLRGFQDGTTTEEGRARRIYRTTIFVVAATSIATGTAGLAFLESSIETQAMTDIPQVLVASRTLLDINFDNRLQRALVVSTEPALETAVTTWINGSSQPAWEQAKRITARLLTHGFSGIALENGNKHEVLAGSLLPDSAISTRLNSPHDVTLVWQQGYYLRVRIPIKDTLPGTSYLVTEQTLPYIDTLFKEANSVAGSSTLAMCSRMAATQLLCFPQREHAVTYVIPDTIKGAPLPMAHALSGDHGIAPLVDYRGRNVLAAFGPVGSTGLGLVFRKDLAEIYAPIKVQALYALPFILFMVGFGLWFIYLRVKPLLEDLSTATASEKAARVRFEAAMQSSPDAFVIYESILDPGGEIVDFRYACLYRHSEAIDELAVNDAVGRSLLERLPGHFDIVEKYRSAVLTGETLVDEFSVQLATGPTLWYQRQTVPMPDGVAVTFRNITRQKILRQTLENSNRLRSAILQNAAYSIIATDVEGTILTFNKAAERMLWYREDEVVGKTNPGIFHDINEIRDYAAALTQELGFVVEPGMHTFMAKANLGLAEDREWTYVRKDGSRLPVQVSITALRDSSNVIQGYLGIAYDISEQKRAEEYIRHIALHDVLTGLPNRALLDDRMQVAIEQQRRHGTSFALAMMDVDRFKTINDSLGHHVGDQILNEFVNRVKLCIRPTDTLARMGGDEFVLLLSDSDAEGAELVASRIRSELEPLINTGTQELRVTTSMGISICPDNGHDSHELMRCADVAMYWVKEHGRNGYKVYAREMDSDSAERLNIESELHRALEHDGFTLFYQPKVDLRSNAILGVEALIRMNAPDNKFILPDTFISVAEETGLIVPIGEWVLNAACRDAMRMQESFDVPLSMAVNISPRQFISGDIVKTVRDALQAANLNARQLELEITEGVLVDERSGVSGVLSKLHDLGIKLAIDDFGTGYSSLSYLKRYPIDELKIDQSFVRDVINDSGDAALAMAIIAMGRSLDIPVIAEGIETGAQLAFLAMHGCDQGQGFYIGRPMSYEALVEWLANDSLWSLRNTPKIRKRAAMQR